MTLEELKKTWPSRIAAVGFILFFLAGNLWLATALVGGKPEEWMGMAFAVGIFVSLFGGGGLVGLMIWRYLRQPGSSDDKCS